MPIPLLHGYKIGGNEGHGTTVVRVMGICAVLWWGGEWGKAEPTLFSFT